MTTDPHQIQLSDELLKLLGELTARTGKSPQDVLSDALRQFRPAVTNGDEETADTETVYDALNRKGLIGCIKGSPSDLSTNPKYMEGFGRRDS